MKLTNISYKGGVHTITNTIVISSTRNNKIWITVKVLAIVVGFSVFVLKHLYIVRNGIVKPLSCSKWKPVYVNQLYKFKNQLVCE